MKSAKVQEKKLDVMSYNQYLSDLKNSEDGNTRIENMVGEVKIK